MTNKVDRLLYIVLGWNTGRADFTAGLGIYAPTGEFEALGDSNRGRGMWSYELFGGTTVYFDEAKSWHFAAFAAYETHGEKDGTDIRVGDILTLEGGLLQAALATKANPAGWRSLFPEFRPGLVSFAVYENQLI